MWSKSSLNASTSEAGFIPKKAAARQRLIPCTVHEIVTSQQKGDTFLSTNNLELNLVSILGIIKSVNESPSFIDYEIDDRTGSRIIVKQFNDQENIEGAHSKATTVYEVNTYVRVVGQIKSRNTINFINAIKIMPIRSYNEVTLHIVSVVYTHKSLEAMERSSTVAPQSGAGAQSSGSDMTEKIIKIFRNATGQQGNDGLSTSFIVAALPEYSGDVIRQKLEFMSTEGHIYSTVSEDVFKLTE